MLDAGLKDKRVLLTGANHGIGAAAACAFAAEGAQVVIHFLQAAPVDPPPTTFRALDTVKGRSAAVALLISVPTRPRHLQVRSRMARAKPQSKLLRAAPPSSLAPLAFG